MDGRYTVTDEDWALAGVVMKQHRLARAAAIAELHRDKEELAVAAGKLEGVRADAAEERREQRRASKTAQWILERLSDGEWTTQGDLNRACSKSLRTSLVPTLEQLVQDGRLKRAETNGPNKGVKYMLAA